MKFTLENFRPTLEALPGRGVLWVGFSGGLDSTVLLHGMAGLRSVIQRPMCAVHVHHGLHREAGHWTAHCQSVCATFAVPLEIRYVEAAPVKGHSPEAVARKARYDALAALLGDGDCLLTAHHRDDQAETLLLQLLRGSGPKGLAAMPEYRRFHNGWHARPLLGYGRQALHDYAVAQGLEWIEDSSNVDIGYDRNYLRHEIVPLLQRRWPSAAHSLARSARHCADAVAVLDAMADLDLRDASAAPDSQCLSIEHLMELDEARQRNALRRWIHRQGLPMPADAHLDRVLRDVIQARGDAEPCVHWDGAEVRRYRDCLYAMAPLAAHDSLQTWRWDMNEPLIVASLGLQLRAESVHGKGLAARALAHSPVRVRFREGGERCRPAGRSGHHSLKKLFQEAGVPPWLRGRIPLVYCGDELAAVVGYWICESFQAQADEPGWLIHCEPVPT